MHILVIEDIGILALEVEDLLREAGYTSIDLASTVDEALELANKQCPDLIIADCRLPDGTGVEAVRDICREHGFIPTIYTVGFREDVLALDPVATVLEKPFDGASLLALTQSMTCLTPRQPR